MDRAALLERTKKELRSLLISAPRGVPARMLYKDYKMVIGKELPYRQLGFRNADEFVQSLSDVVRLGFGPTGEQTYFGVANAETAQISRFVASQKKPKLKKSHAPPPTIARTPMRMAAFTRKSHYGPRPYFKGGSTSRGGRPGPLLASTFPPHHSPFPPHHSPPHPSFRSYPQPWAPPLLPLSMEYALLPHHPHHPLHHPPHHLPFDHPHHLPLDPPHHLPLEHPHHLPLDHPHHLPLNHPRHLPLDHPHHLPLDPPHNLPFDPPHDLPHHFVPHPTSLHMAQSILLFPCHQPERTPLPPAKFPQRPHPSYGPYTGQSRPNFPPRYPPQREVYRPDTSSSRPGGISSSQNLIIRALNPSFHQSSSSQERKSPPPRQQLGSLRTGITSPSAEVPGIPPWRKEFERVPEVTIRQLHDKMNDFGFNNTVCITGFSSGKHLEETTKEGVRVLKFLLCTHYNKGKPQMPAVMLYFRPKFWDLKEYPDPLYLGEGARLKVYGGPFIQFSKKKNVGEPACTVMYYERLSPAVRGASSIANSSAHASPQESSQKPTGSAGRPHSLDMLKSGSLEDKVYKLLQSKPHGVYGKRLGKELETMFREAAPADVLHKAKIMPFVKWEELMPGVLILYPKPDYYRAENGEDQPPRPQQDTRPSLSTPEAASPCSPPQWVPKECATSTGREQSARTSQPPRTAQPPHSGSVDLPSQPQSARTPHPPHPPRTAQSPRLASTAPSSHPVISSPPPLLPSTAEFNSDTELFDVYVCHVNSPISFYVQLTGKDSSERFQAMEDGLNKHFSNRAKPDAAASVSVNRLYGYFWEGEGPEDFQWCRALVVAMQDKEASVMFPDYGNSETVQCKDLRQLPDRFCALPFQAIHCCLHGITEIEDEACEKFSELAADKTCVANVMDRSGSRVAVELIVSESECQETVNSILMKDFHPVSTLTPSLPSPGSPVLPVKLTDVDEDGVISLQLMGPGLNCLQQLMNEINNTYSKPRAKASDFVKKVSEGTVYCAKFSVDGNWYRVMVKKILQPDGKVLVEYIDYGNEEELGRLKLRKALDTDLFSLPHQVVKCRLCGLPPPQGKWTEDAMGTVAEYVESEDLQLEVVESASDRCLASVKLFVKSEEEVVSLNDLLLARPALFGLPEAVTAIEEEEEDFAYAGVETSSVSSHSSRVSDGTPEESLVSPEQTEGRLVPAVKQPGNIIMAEEMDMKEVQERFDRLALVEGGKGLQEESVMTHGDVSVTAASPKCELMPGRHTMPVDVTRMDPDVSRYTLPVDVAKMDPAAMSDRHTPPVDVTTMDPTANRHTPPVDVTRMDAAAMSNHHTPPFDVTKVDDAAIFDRHTPPVDITKMDAATMFDHTMPAVVTRMHPAAMSDCHTPPVPVDVTRMDAAAMSDHQDLPVDTSSISISNVPEVLQSNVSISVQPITPATSSSSLQPCTPIGSPSPPASTRANQSSDISYNHLEPYTPSNSPSPSVSPRHRVDRALGSDVSGGGEMRFESLTPLKPVPVTVSWAATPGDFVVLLFSKLDELERMMVRLNTSVNMLPVLASNEVAPGLVCSASSSIDKRWYRAVVISQEDSDGGSGGGITVEFLDYGGRERVLISSVRALPSNFVDLPFQGIRSSLKGISPCGAAWSPLACQYFYRRVVNNQFFAIESERESATSSVFLLDTSATPTTVINDELVIKQHAVKSS